MNLYAFNELKEKNLITEEDVAIVCNQKPSAFASMFGAIGGAIAASNAKYYVLSVNEKAIKLFDIDKKGNYKGTYLEFPKEDIAKVQFGSFLGSKSISIKSKKGTTNLITSNNHFRISQADKVTQVFEIFKSNYSK